MYLHISRIHEPNFTPTTEDTNESETESDDTTEEEEVVKDGDDKCPKCSKVFAKADLKKHILTEHFNLKIQCCHCHQDFKDFIGLGVHKSRMHPKAKNKNQNLKCQICNQKFEAISKLAAHLIKEHAGFKTTEEQEPVTKKSKIGFERMVEN